MWPLAAQLRIAAFQAQEPIFRLRGEEVPAGVIAVRAEGSNAGAEPGTLAQARARLTEALTLLAGVGADEFDAEPNAPLAHTLPMGMVFDLTRATYIRDWALPQLAFHQVTAYAILRQAGVPLGKQDYVPTCSRPCAQAPCPEREGWLAIVASRSRVRLIELSTIYTRRHPCSPRTDRASYEEHCRRTR